jgi:ribosomal protein RSM22 (predicted rRNA methylase)
MTWSLPVELEDAVYAAAAAVVGAAALEPAALARAIIDRSRRYTSERERLAAPADRVADLAARAAFFTLADAMKLAIPLAELGSRGALPQHTPLRIVDLGAGCGAMSLGALAALPCTPLEITAIDHDADALAIAAGALRGRAAIETRTADVATAAIPRAELVVLGSVVNELPVAARLQVIERALGAVGDDGAVIVIEPALRDLARDLHELRDAVLARGLASVFAPCTRTCAPCPALADPDDWCHEHRTVELPPRTAALARVTHLRDSGLKFAYLVLRARPLPLVEGRAWRIVSAPHAAKGKLEMYGCSDAGRWPLRLLRRHRDIGNRSFGDARRGDVVVVAAEPSDGRVEITAETALEVVRPAGR